MDAIECLRRRGRELRADLDRIQSAPYPSGRSKQRRREQIEALAMQGAPSVSLLVEHDGTLIWPQVQLQSMVYAEPRALAFAEMPDAVALIAWLHKDALIKRLDAEIDAESDDKAALSHADREIRAAEAQADLLAVERQECALTWSAIEDGLPFEFGADCSPIAIMQVRLITMPRAGPPDSSEEHAGFNLIGGR